MIMFMVLSSSCWPLLRQTREDNWVVPASHGSAPFNRIWSITILRSPKQQIWLRTALCGGWCRRMALRNRELHARNDDDMLAFYEVRWPRLFTIKIKLSVTRVIYFCLFIPELQVRMWQTDGRTPVVPYVICGPQCRATSATINISTTAVNQWHTLWYLLLNRQ